MSHLCKAVGEIIVLYMIFEVFTVVKTSISHQESVWRGHPTTTVHGTTTQNHDFCSSMYFNL